jgi:hypothetical protein
MEERLARWLVEAERGWRHAGASVDLVGAMLLLAKRLLKEFHRLRRLGPSTMKPPADCWHNRPFG